MAEKKKQHYVPRLYLRQFSGPEDSRRISLYNIAGVKYIRRTAIRNQGCRDYFYGHDKSVEDSIQPLEESAAKVIRSVTSHDTLPSRHTEDDQILLVFCLLLKARTAWAGEEVLETFDQLTKAVMSHDPVLRDKLDQFRVFHPHPELISMQHALQSVIIATDLNVALAINKTPQAFITSDNPVVCYNQFMETRKLVGSSTGLASKGLQMFIPISPRHCLIYFDSDVYNVGSERNPVFSVNREGDVWGLNQLQVLNARENIYCDLSVTEDYLTHLHMDVARHRRIQKSEICEYVSRDNPMRSLYRQSRIDIKCGLQLTFMKVLRKAKEWLPDNRAVHMRNEGLCRAFHQFCEEVEKGKYRPGQFNKYLRDISEDSEPTK